MEQPKRGRGRPPAKEPAADCREATNITPEERAALVARVRAEERKRGMKVGKALVIRWALRAYLGLKP